MKVDLKTAGWRCLLWIDIQNYSQVKKRATKARFFTRIKAKPESGVEQ